MQLLLQNFRTISSTLTNSEMSVCLGYEVGTSLWFCFLLVNFDMLMVVMAA